MVAMPDSSQTRFMVLHRGDAPLHPRPGTGEPPAVEEACPAPSVPRRVVTAHPVAGSGGRRWSVTGRTADDFYLIAHDERSGRCRVSPRRAGVAAAAGLLAELMMAGHLRAVGRRVFPCPRDEPPADPLLRDVLESVYRARSGLEVEHWLVALRPHALRDVRDRLVASGVLTEVVTRRWFGPRRSTFVPTDPGAPGCVRSRLANGLSAGAPMPPEDLVLTGLAEVTGLLETVVPLRLDDDPGTARAAERRRELPVQLRELVVSAYTAVGSGPPGG